MEFPIRSVLYSRVITYSSYLVAPARVISFLPYGSLTVFTSLFLLIVDPYQTWKYACSLVLKHPAAHVL